MKLNIVIQLHPYLISPCYITYLFSVTVIDVIAWIHLNLLDKTFSLIIFLLFLLQCLSFYFLWALRKQHICNKNVASNLASHFGKRICSPSNLRYCLWFHSISNRECLTSFQTSLDKTFFKSFPNCITYFPLNVMGYIVPTPEKNPWLDCVFILRHASDKTFY